MPKYFDTHSHLHFPQYDKDRDEVIARMKEEGVWTTLVGTAFHTSQSAVELAREHEGFFATIGVHPTDTNESFDLNAFEEILDGNVVAIGECGFDYYRTPKEEVYDQQREVFIAQIEFALAHSLPLMLHVRPSEGSQDAHEDTFLLLERYKNEYGEKLRGNAHFFTGSLEVAERYWALGFTTAFPGVITFTNVCDEVVKNAPIEMILSETDAPYAAPVPFRGQRNEPIYVAEVVKAIARIRGEDEGYIGAQMVLNARRLFGIG